MGKQVFLIHIVYFSEKTVSFGHDQVQLALPQNKSP